ncbi:hypothetical protein FH972_023999 [Carpinus fangiana]|uniref:Calcineurin-like phosphoesterase domain-containing protein n=1 Tax=Carpinus fangiana TaxID=176857 RepID=A0A5N6KX27_9ROSI|nr:hypothetical protein FH972_023999 [Carpinus fangiana]
MGDSKSLTLQILSDLHLEVSGDYLDFHIPTTAPRLLLAGDIGTLSSPHKLTGFVECQCSNYEHVYLVLGNHEFYGMTRQAGLEAAAKLEQEPGAQNKLHILQRTRVDLDERVTLLGCTLQSHIPPESRDMIQRQINDFRQIQGWTIDHHNEEHERDVAWLQSQVQCIAMEDPHRSIIIATHHAPTMKQTSNPIYRDSPRNCAFATSVIESRARYWKGYKQIDTWIFGHTHWSTDIKVDHVRVMANQRGYVLNGKTMEQSAGKKPWYALTKTRFIEFDAGATITV